MHGIIINKSVIVGSENPSIYSHEHSLNYLGECLAAGPGRREHQSVSRMADVGNATTKDWVAKIKDDLDPLSWFVLGYEGKERIGPVASGTGEAEAYWDDLLGLLRDDAIMFAFTRVVMGDAESRRPKVPRGPNHVPRS